MRVSIGWLSTLLLGSAAMLAACGGTVPAGSPAAGSTAASAASPSVSSQAASPAAKPSAAVPANTAPIKIGYLAPLTGSLANSGKDQEDGLNFFLASVDNTIAGRKIEVVYADTEATADVGLAKARQLVESDKVSILMGTTATPVCNAVAEYVKQAEVPLMVTGPCSAVGLTTNPKFKSPYLARFSLSIPQIADPAPDWAYNKGYRKAILIASDFEGGLEIADSLASAFVQRGGSIVQELYPPVGASDYGPYLAQLNQSADVILTFLPGSDGLRFLQQYGNYSAPRKAQIVDMGGQATNGQMLAQEGEAAVGIVADDIYSEAFDSAQNKSFVKAFHDKYPGRVLSDDVAQAYAGGQILQAALEKVNGQVEQKQQLLDALYATNMETVKGPVKLDAAHDVIQNIYVYQITKDAAGHGQKLLYTYKDLSRNWDRTPEELDHLPFGQLKDKWVGMTKAQLEQLAR